VSRVSTGGSRSFWPLIDYAAKLGLACPVTATQTGHDLCSVLNTAVARAEELLGHDLIQDCVDPETGEIIPIFVVTDNGPAMKTTPGGPLVRRPVTTISPKMSRIYSWRSAGAAHQTGPSQQQLGQ